MAIKPILFNTEMVKAILDGRKTQTRRIIKDKYFDPLISDPKWRFPVDPGDILWVRETWNVNNLREKEPGEFEVGFIYAASEAPTHGFRWVKTTEENYQKYEDGMSWYFSGWRPSIHMPKEAARIFLLVKSVRAERMKSISPSDAMDEGFSDWNDLVRVWNSTIKKPDLNEYGWAANPWVWVIEFEQTEQELPF